MTTTPKGLPDDIAALQAALIAERARAAQVEAELAVAKAMASDDEALIAHQRLQIAKLTRALYLPERHAGAILEVGCWAHYLESDFIWSDWPTRQHSPATTAGGGSG